MEGIREGLTSEPQKKTAATGAAVTILLPLFQDRILQEIQTRRYFFSSVAVEAGGAGVAAGGFAGGFAAGVFGWLFIPSLKLRMPSPSPRITSGIFLPPKSSTITAKMIIRWNGLNASITHLPSKCFSNSQSSPGPSRLPIQPSITRSSPTRRVTCSRSRCSSRGIAYLRVTPVSSLNAVIGRRSPRSLRYFANSSRSRASALL